MGRRIGAPTHCCARLAQAPLLLECPASSRFNRGTDRGNGGMSYLGLNHILRARNPRGWVRYWSYIASCRALAKYRSDRCAAAFSRLDAQKYASARKSCMVTTLNGSIAVEHMLQACDSAQCSSCPRCFGPRNSKIGSFSHWLHRSAWPVESRHEAISQRNDESLAEPHALSTHSTTMDPLRVVIVQMFRAIAYFCA